VEHGTDRLQLALLERMARAGHRTLSSFATACGINRQSISLASRGRPIERNTALRMASVLGCTVDELVGLGFVIRDRRAS
jgi:plasmid maintenance system antidote protein VapI